MSDGMFPTTNTRPHRWVRSMESASTVGTYTPRVWCQDCGEPAVDENHARSIVTSCKATRSPAPIVVKEETGGRGPGW